MGTLIIEEDCKALQEPNIKRYETPVDARERGSRRLTLNQIFYIFIQQGVGAAIIDGGVNFGIACGMYRSAKTDIRLWPIEKHTIAGDLGVTVVVQSILTMLITSIIVRSDLRRQQVHPFPFAWPDIARRVHKRKLYGWAAKVLGFISLPRSITLRHGVFALFKTLVTIALQGFVLSVFYFCITWPIAIAIMAPKFGKVDMRGSWTPEVTKAIFGGILGLIQNPLVAAFTLGAHNVDQNVIIKSKASLQDCRSGSPEDPDTPRIITQTPIVRVKSPMYPVTALENAQQDMQEKSSASALLSAR